MQRSTTWARRTLVGMAAVVTAGLGLALLGSAPAAANTSGTPITPVDTLASGLTDRLAATVTSPTDIAFTPDGRGLITTDEGRLRVLRPGGLVPGAAVNLTARIRSGGERGLLGVTVDPGFEANRWIYLFWTFDKNEFCGVATDQTPVNRVTRYRLRANDTVAPGSARLIVDNIPSPATNHNAGDLEFGADGMLYITTGDGGCEIGASDECGAANDNSRRLDLPLGKVLRVTPTGGVPADNPYVGAVDARRCTAPGGPDPGYGPCTETFASGFRNPFRMDIRPGTSTTVGQRRRTGHVGGDRQGHVRGRLRLERPRGLLPDRFDRRLRPVELHRPSVRLRPRRRLPVDHRRRIRAQGHLGRTVRRRVLLRRLRLRFDLAPRPGGRLVRRQATGSRRQSGVADLWPEPSWSRPLLRRVRVRPDPAHHGVVNGSDVATSLPASVTWSVLVRRSGDDAPLLEVDADRVCATASIGEGVAAHHRRRAAGDGCACG